MNNAKQKHNLWTERELRDVYQEFMSGTKPCNLAKRQGILSAQLLGMFSARGWPLRGRCTRARVDDELIHAMHAEYMSGMKLNAVARRHQRSGRALRDLFSSRGLFIRYSNGFPAKGKSGRFEVFFPKSEADIEALIAGATRLVVPLELKNDWAKWTMERRGEFIARLRARLNDPKARPELPCSANVLPFDYTTPAAWDIVRRRNAGVPSQYWKTKLNIKSQGMIWNGRLFFWAGKTSCYMEGIKWSSERGRPSLNRAIWESVHGPIPDGGVIRARDGNPNNLDPSNLVLSDRNELVRENQSRHLTKQSRETTQILLNRHQSPPSHGLPDTLHILARR